MKRVTVQFWVCFIDSCGCQIHLYNREEEIEEEVKKVKKKRDSERGKRRKKSLHIYLKIVMRWIF
jgi:hypothetical protein